MPARTVIRDFCVSDQDVTRALILEGLREHWGTLDPRFNRDLDDIDASYRHGRTLVAFDGTRLVGTGAVVPRPGEAAEILRMSVAEDARRTGLGGALVRSLVATAREWRCRRVVLETASDWTGVIAFYRQSGFTPTHEVDGDFCRDTWFEMHL